MRLTTKRSMKSLREKQTDRLSIGYPAKALSQPTSSEVIMKQIQNSSDMYDAVIVGAGAAGIGAARTLIKGGARVILLEARNRLGGRAYCDNPTFPIPVDLGAQWFHQGLANPLRIIAQQAGYTTVHDAFPRVVYAGDQPLEADDPRVLEFTGVAV